MYYVYAVGRNYNIAISPARAGTLARFRSRLENCNGSLFRVDCDIDITYNWSDDTPGSGTNTITLTSGSNTVQETPSGYTLTSLEIVSISGPSCTYNNIGACIDSSITTTTTTTTSTTTTTTTVAAASYSDPPIKFDHYSGSWGVAGSPIWPNVGSSGSAYDLGPGINFSISSQGTGTGKYLRMYALPYGEFWGWPFEGSFINFGEMSFSYAAVFRAANPSFFGTVGEVTVDVPITNEPGTLGADYGGFYFYNSVDFSKEVPPQIGATVFNYQETNDWWYYDPTAAAYVSETSKWYLTVLTYDKNASYTNAAKLYINTSAPINLSRTNGASWNPSTFFPSNMINQELIVGSRPDEIDIAAIMFWQHTILTAGQIQSLFNEYNSRYTLG